MIPSGYFVPPLPGRETKTKKEELPIRDYSSVKLAAPSIDGRAPFAQGHENKEKKD